MPDEIKPNLEPVEENDLNLKEKFLGGAESPKEESAEKLPEVSSQEGIKVPENLERKEGQVEKDEAYSKILSQVAGAVPAVDEDVSKDAEILSKEQDAEGKINNLVALAQTKSIPHAVKVARHYEDNYVLDEFHDRLMAEDLHAALVKQGLIKEI